MSVQGSFVLWPPDDEIDEMMVYKAGLPVLAPPDTIPTPKPHDTALDDSSLRKIDDALPKRDIDNLRLRAHEPAKSLSKSVD